MIQDIVERKRYALFSFLLVCLWLFLVLIIILLEGFGGAGTEVTIKSVPVKFKLSEAIVLALIGSTTINVIGLFVVVVKYLFPNTSEAKQSSKIETK